jgi:hypothetical protein
MPFCKNCELQYEASASYRCPRCGAQVVQTDEDIEVAIKQMAVTGILEMLLLTISSLEVAKLNLFPHVDSLKALYDIDNSEEGEQQLIVVLKFVLGGIVDELKEMRAQLKRFDDGLEETIERVSLTLKELG